MPLHYTALHPISTTSYQHTLSIPPQTPLSTPPSTPLFRTPLTPPLDPPLSRLRLSSHARAPRRLCSLPYRVYTTRRGACVQSAQHTLTRPLSFSLSHISYLVLPFSYILSRTPYLIHSILSDTPYRNSLYIQNTLSLYPPTLYHPLPFSLTLSLEGACGMGSRPLTPSHTPYLIHHVITQSLLIQYTPLTHCTLQPLITPSPSLLLSPLKVRAVWAHDLTHPLTHPISYIMSSLSPF